MTKPITTAAVMMLAEDKKISITDPVSKFLPEFENLLVFDESGNHKPAKKQITIIDLMRHTSGLTYGFVGGDVAKIYKSKNVLDRNSSEGNDEKSLSNTIRRRTRNGMAIQYSHRCSRKTRRGRLRKII